MRVHEKFVSFDKYCPLCKHYDLPEEEEPCNTCIETIAREDTHKPIKYEVKKEYGRK